jgi:AcrR family transcriptional regulator
MLETAMRRFAEHGYQRTRVEDIAEDLGIAKGSIFLHFKSKRGLFFEAYRKAATSLPGYMDAPRPVLDGGVFEVVRYWLEQSEPLAPAYRVPVRILLLGDYAVDIDLQREIKRFKQECDPYGTQRLVRYGIERGDLRSDVQSSLLASTIDWMLERFQDVLLADELGPIRRGPKAATRQRIDQFVRLLRDAVGPR